MRRSAFPRAVAASRSGVGYAVIAARMMLKLAGRGSRHRWYRLALRADLRVPLPEWAHVRALPVDDCAGARAVRRVRCFAARDRSVSGRDPLQGLGLLLDRLRQGREKGERRLGRRRVEARHEDGVQAGLEAGRDEVETGRVRRLIAT